MQPGTVYRWRWWWLAGSVPPLSGSRCRRHCRRHRRRHRWRMCYNIQYRPDCATIATSIAYYGRFAQLVMNGSPPLPPSDYHRYFVRRRQWPCNRNAQRRTSSRQRRRSGIDLIAASATSSIYTYPNAFNRATSIGGGIEWAVYVPDVH